RESFGGGSWIGRSVPEGGSGTLRGWEECRMVCVARLRNVGRMGSGGKGGGIFGPGSPTSVGADRIRPPHAFEPGWRGSEDGPRPWKGPGSLPFAPFSLPAEKLSGNATASYAARQKILWRYPWK